MFRSLRFRLPALFLLGIVLAAVVATLIAVRFFQSYTRTHAASSCVRSRRGSCSCTRSRPGSGTCPSQNLQLALGGDEMFWVPVVPGASLLAGPLPELPRDAVPARRHLGGGKPPAFDLHVRQRVVSRASAQVVTARPGSRRARSSSRSPNPRCATAGSSCAASSRSRSGSGSRWSGILVVYFSRRIARPLEALTAAADEVAAGHYDVARPERTAAAARSSGSRRGSARWRRGSRSRRSCPATSSCPSRTSCARR